MRTNATTMTAWVPKTFGTTIDSTLCVTGVSPSREARHATSGPPILYLARALGDGVGAVRFFVPSREARRKIAREEYPGVVSHSTAEIYS